MPAAWTSSFVGDFLMFIPSFPASTYAKNAPPYDISTQTSPNPGTFVFTSVNMHKYFLVYFKKNKLDAVIFHPKMNVPKLVAVLWLLAMNVFFFRLLNHFVNTCMQQKQKNTIS